jgi:hypothetical protein
MRSIKIGDHVQLGRGATGRVVATANGAPSHPLRLRRSAREESGHYLAHVLRPYGGKPRGWRC